MTIPVPKHHRKPPPQKVSLWECLDLETQMTLIHLGLVDPEKVGVSRERTGPRLILFESREELERIMREKPRYTIFQPTLRGLRSLKLSFQDPVPQGSRGMGRNDRADHRKP